MQNTITTLEQFQALEITSMVVEIDGQYGDTLWTKFPDETWITTTAIWGERTRTNEEMSEGINFRDTTETVVVK